jgi:hypothetical protein
MSSGSNLLMVERRRRLEIARGRGRHCFYASSGKQINLKDRQDQQVGWASGRYVLGGGSCMRLYTPFPEASCPRGQRMTHCLSLHATRCTRFPTQSNTSTEIQPKNQDTSVESPSSHLSEH